jgi:hypothetical protein
VGGDARGHCRGHDPMSSDSGNLILGFCIWDECRELEVRGEASEADDGYPLPVRGSRQDLCIFVIGLGSVPVCHIHG